MDALIPRLNSVSRDTDGLRAPELEHPVQSIHSNGCFRHLTTMRARAEGITDHPLVPADRPFRQGAPIVAAVLLPAHTAALRDLLQMPITLRRRGVRGVARHGGRAWRHDNRGLRMTFGNCVVDIIPVVRPITSKRSERWLGLSEQRLGLNKWNVCRVQAAAICGKPPK